MADHRAGLAGVAVAFVAVTAIGASTSSARSNRVACGEERWTVKTLQDRPVLRPARVTTVHYLVTRPAPAYLPDTRLPFERNVFTVTASVVLVRAEDDGDFHGTLRPLSGVRPAEPSRRRRDSREVEAEAIVS